MEINITKQKNSSICEDLGTINLGKYTVLAGKNNAGKTNIIKAILDHSDLSSFEKIYIPAENNDPNDNETSTSVKGTSFYKALEKIIAPIFDTNFVDDILNKFNSSPEKKDFIDSVNKNLKNLNVDKKELDIDFKKEDLKDSVIIKIIKAVVKDLYKTDIDKVDIDNVGMGTKRLIITAMVQYYEKSRLESDKKKIFIIEEPEVYLHPEWKKSLHKSLLELSRNEDFYVLITTHDPYFIELTKNQKIYNVYRDPNKNDCTTIGEVSQSVLEFESDAEKNYLIFNLPSKSYFLELYEYLLSFIKESTDRCRNPECNKPFKSRYKLLNDWIIEKKENGLDIEMENSTNPKISNLRQKIAHHNCKDSIPEDEIKKGIEELMSLIKMQKDIKQDEIAEKGTQ